MTKEREKVFQIADKCHICNKWYIDKGIPVRDHYHMTDKYRGSAQKM